MMINSANMLDLGMLGASLTEEQAREIFALGEEAVVFALLAMAKQVAVGQAKIAAESHQAPAAPSGMKPPYTKPPGKKRKRRPGAKAGHDGSRRAAPERIDRREKHRAQRCPDCGGRLKRCGETRTRIVEDIPEYRPEVTEHTIHRDWCPRCKKKVEPKVPDALPGSTLGNRVLVLTAWLHYALGNTLAQIADVFDYHLQMKITPGGLMRMWRRLAEILWPWYEEIHDDALDSLVLHADETGWRVDGKTHWLWCFTSADSTFYMIDRSRGSPAVRKFFREQFAGTLVTDFWWPYNAVCCADRQMCLAHLLRELEKVERYKSPGGHWPDFAKRVRRLLGDAIRLWRRREELPAPTVASRRARLDARLAALIETPWKDANAKRLVKRFRRHRDNLFTFLDQPNVPFDNNPAERAIRPAVILRKNSQGNRSAEGAECQSILMTIFRTLKQRGHDPIRTIGSTLADYITTGQLSPLPKPKSTSDG